MNWINVQQQGFYRSLTGALKAMRDDGSKLWLMVGLSFAYGIFHAAGPGHGKAVISSYMLANEVALKRGILLSFVSAFLQALTAIVVMTLAFLVLRGTSVSMTDATWFLEVASYALITAFGAWLLWQKAGPRILGLFGANPAYSLSAAHAHSHGHAGHSHSHASAFAQPCRLAFARRSQPFPPRPFSPRSFGSWARASRPCRGRSLRNLRPFACAGPEASGRRPFQLEDRLVGGRGGGAAGPAPAR